MENTPIENLKIFNQLGKIVFQEDGLNQPKKQINIKSLSTGIYILTINNVINKRLVIK